MNRIVIIGVTGSGKSTLASRLAQKLNYPIIELDDIYWSPSWTAAEKTKFRADVVRAASTENWIAVGNYSAVRDILWPAADTLIWLDLSFPLCLARLLRRTLHRARHKTVICNGNYETLIKAAFSKDSIVYWLLRTYRAKKREYAAVFATQNQPSVKTWLRLRTPQDIKTFLSNL